MLDRATVEKTTNSNHVIVRELKLLTLLKVHLCDSDLMELVRYSGLSLPHAVLALRVGGYCSWACAEFFSDATD